jgi:hypothetical protein
MDEQTQTPVPETELTRVDDFVSLYANSVQFELSVWDLKMIFGQLEQGGGKVRIEQHTAVTIPWMQAKLMSHLLNFNLAVYEAEYGKVAIPDRLLPVMLPLPENTNDPKARAQLELATKLRDEFIASLK